MTKHANKEEPGVSTAFILTWIGIVVLANLIAANKLSPLVKVAKTFISNHL
jgi:hypothetical protein